jgi:hypothetical protein
MRVDESFFSVLYTEGQDAHNASIRVLVDMMNVDFHKPTKHSE